LRNSFYFFDSQQARNYYSILGYVVNANGAVTDVIDSFEEFERPILALGFVLVFEWMKVDRF
jgi:hypothetical protein